MSKSGNTPDVDEVAKVLYIEDNFANIKLMQDIFSEFLPYVLLSASSAEQGIELTKQEKPDLILMDINLDGMTGYQALEIIKNDSDIASIPVIAISADVIPGQNNEGVAEGFVDYISKPFDLTDLIARLKQHLG
ncbi:MAG: response regulator [Gammaproteobacteria bacterium]|nr:response regulator [Gammaproteobacteria bacterium]